MTFYYDLGKNIACLANNKNSFKTTGYRLILSVVWVVIMGFGSSYSYAQQSVVDEILPKLHEYDEENTARVDVLLQLAEGYLFVSPQRSEELGSEAKELAESLEYTNGLIRSNLLIGRSFQFRGDFVNDINFFTEGLVLAEQNDNIPFIAEIYRNMGEHYLFVGNHAEALEKLQYAVSFAERQDNKRLIAASYFSMGGFFLKLEKLDDAESYFLKALPIFEEINEQRGVAVLFGSLGMINQQKGEYELALEYLTKNIDIFNSLGDYLSLAESYLIMGQLDKQFGRADEAIEKLNNALFYAETSKDLNNKTMILIELGLMSLELKNYPDAVAHLDEALLLAQSLEVKENEMGVHDAFTKLYKETGEIDKSLAHLEDYNKIRDQLYPLSHGEELLKIQNQFEVERRESELNSLRRIQAENNLKMERESTRLNTAIAAIIFVVMLVVVMAIRYNAKANAAKQMAHHNGQLLEIGKELENVSKVKSDFLANTSHEIRTPLNGILGMVTLLSQSSMSGTQKEQVRAIELSGKKLLDLVNDLLDLTKIEAGKIEINYAPMNIASSIATELAIWDEMAKADNLELKVNISDDLPFKVTGASARIVQVLTNLVGNAVKFTQSGSVKLSISIEKDFGQEVLVLFEVEDTGIGIAEDKLDILFERFSQIDSGFSRSFQGTGLGLAISRDLVRIMNGSIGVDSIEGEGSSFWFRLPMHINDRDKPRNEVELNVYNSKKSNELQVFNILVAEDNAINQAVIKGMLEHLGHNAIFVNNGEEVVNRIVSIAPDIILMDIQMPIMDGEQATKEIRKMKGKVANTPIIAITANAMAGDAERFVEIGMDAYLAKPVNIERLQRTLIEMKDKVDSTAS
jgi:signal transduction histidine kinase/ActR/RegA family two-component response regulator